MVLVKPMDQRMRSIWVVMDRNIWVIITFWRRKRLKRNKREEVGKH